VRIDDARIQQIRAEAKPDSNIARMLDWLRTTRIPVVTSIPHPDYPALEAFPLAEVLSAHPYGYFNSTAAYAIAYAIHVGARKISCFGMDFTYPDAHTAEKGRACVEFWLGIAAARGIELCTPKTTSLLDAMNPQELRFYGYDCVKLDMKRNARGALVIKKTKRKELPTAEQIEHAYCHNRHPNKLVESGNV